MAALALVDCVTTLNSVDMSQYVAAVELDVTAAQLDTTDFASDGWQEFIAGLKSGSIRFRFLQDFASTTVDDRLWALFATVTTFAVRPDDAGVGATNPEFQGSLLVNRLTPVMGAVGDLATQDLTWPISGAVTRAVA